MNSASTTPLVGRLAPSPTGYLHLGHVRSLLLAWWSARSRGGLVRLRVEDLDTHRCRPEYFHAMFEDLEWLGLDWDGDALVQSAHQDAYREACQRLLETGQAFACTCTRAEIQAAAAPHPSDGETRYPGTCNGRWESPDSAREATGHEPGLRVRAPRRPQSVVDKVVGQRVFDVESSVGDFMIRRRDGIYAYQLAVVVDDARQGVTEVVRGDDLLSSAARQEHLQTLLDLPHPEWRHVPLVVDSSGRRLAKRDHDTSLTALRANGADPRAIIAWAARSSGQEVDERASAAEVASVFRWERLNGDPAVLTPGCWRPRLV